MKLKKISSMLMAVVMLLISLPIGAVEVNAATTLSESEFAEKIVALQNEYPQGKYWNEYNGKDSQGIAKAGSKVCSGTSNADGKSCVKHGYCAYGGSCSCLCGNYYGWQCFGFANLMAYKVFGSYATSNYSSSGVNKSKGWQYSTSVNTYYAGDVVRIDNSHSIFLTKVTDTHAYYVDCNYKGPCMIYWENEITLSQLKSRTTFVVHMSGNTLTGNGKVTPTLSIQYHANGGVIANSETVTGYRYKVTESIGINMRSGAGTSYGVVTSLSKGTTFDVAVGETKTANGYTWGKTTVSGKTGWVVISDFVEKTQTLRSTDYYIQDSMIFTTKHSAVHQQNLQYGVLKEQGLYNDTTFKLTRDGYTFLGWTLTRDGDEIWDQDASLYPEQLCPELKNGDQTIVVYAKWQKNECQHSASVQTQAATCTQAGYTVTTCTICGVELSRTEIPATGHSYSEKVTNPTCTADGSKVYTCSKCGDNYSQTLPATGHSYDGGVVTTEPTCVSNGVKTFTCKNCGNTYTESISAKGHTETTVTVGATCVDNGYTAVVCETCGVELSRTEIPATGHSYTETITNATCTADGSKVYTCSNCADSYTETIPATGHDYKNNVCTSCGDVLIVEYGVELHVSDAKATAGETVTVDIVLDKNVGFTYLNLLLDYDETVMELVSVTNGTIVNSLTQGRSYIWAQADNAVATGVLATLTFAVKEDALAGDYAVTAEVIECCNENEQDVAVLAQNGTVTVVDFVYGDCNGDNAVNGKDVTRLLRYLANYDPVSGTSEFEISLGADVTGDGEINGKDVTRLLRYLANFDPVTGESSVELG